MTENGARFVFGKRTTYINEIEEMQYMTKHEVVATLRRYIVLHTTGTS
jgi:hypothetical protein